MALCKERGLVRGTVSSGCPVLWRGCLERPGECKRGLKPKGENLSTRAHEMLHAKRRGQDKVKNRERNCVAVHSMGDRRKSRL